jgi:hypothetical protein
MLSGILMLWPRLCVTHLNRDRVAYPPIIEFGLCYKFVVLLGGVSKGINKGICLCKSRSSGCFDRPYAAIIRPELSISG